jgi:hypothetical protein
MSKGEEYRHPLWRCPRCTLEKSPDQFYADRPGLAGALFWCRSCVSQYIEDRRKKRNKRLTAEAPTTDNMSKVTKDAA